VAIGASWFEGTPTGEAGVGILEAGRESGDVASDGMAASGIDGADSSAGSAIDISLHPR
jgi:hypothetical protein